MRDSKPARVRYSGGYFGEGPLHNGQKYAGLTRYFNQGGRLKDKYMSLLAPRGTVVKRPVKELPAASETQPRERSRRTVRAPNPIGNQNFLPFTPKQAIQNADEAITTSRQPQHIVEPPFTPLTTNLWNKNKFPDWKLPGGTSGNDRHPSAAAESGIQGDLCGHKACDCILTRVANRASPPEIVSAGGMGEGLRATASYEVGDYLGELVGELVPLESQYHHDGWASLLVTDNGACCHIHSRYFGNWTRKINHSCEANSVFRSVKISGIWCVMVEAVSPIPAGATITVSYGNRYWEDQDAALCLCGSKKCISKKKEKKKEESPIVDK